MKDQQAIAQASEATEGMILAVNEENTRQVIGASNQNETEIFRQ